MVNRVRDFRAPLLEELKYFYRCTQKEKNPNHFCTQSELSKNLNMSLRDVGKTLHQLTTEGLLKHDKSKQKGRLQDRFIPTNERLYESKEMIEDMERNIQDQLTTMRELAVKMRDRPAIKEVKSLPVLPHPDRPDQISEAHSLTGKIDKIGQNHLDEFCDIVNKILSYIDSMNYATYDGSLEADELTDKVIKNLRKNTMTEINQVIQYSLNPHSARQSQLLLDMIRQRIPTFFTLAQMQKMSKIRI
jgi:predicted transcriptional regulator